MRIVDVIFSRRPVRDSLGIALAVALFIHGALLVWAARAEPSLEAWAANIALSVHDDLAREDVVTLEPEQLPPPKKVISEAPRSLEPTPAKAAEVAPPAPAAAAANVMTSDADAVVDLSGDTVVKGNAVAPAGGITRNEATPVAPTQPTIDRSQKVTLAGGEWACPSPKTAHADIVDAQSVVIKVDVAVSGAVLDARVVKDSAGGFGEAAIGCARKTRFKPALDRDGNPVRAWSPPIEVGFSR